MKTDAVIKGGRPDTFCARVLCEPIVFLRFCCSILVLLIKTIHCSIVRCSIPHCILFVLEGSGQFLYKRVFGLMAKIVPVRIQRSSSDY